MLRIRPSQETIGFFVLLPGCCQQQHVCLFTASCNSRSFQVQPSESNLRPRASLANTAPQFHRVAPLYLDDIFRSSFRRAEVHMFWRGLLGATHRRRCRLRVGLGRGGANRGRRTMRRHSRSAMQREVRHDTYQQCSGDNDGRCSPCRPMCSVDFPARSIHLIADLKNGLIRRSGHPANGTESAHMRVAKTACGTGHPFIDSIKIRERHLGRR